MKRPTLHEILGFTEAQKAALHSLESAEAFLLTFYAEEYRAARARDDPFIAIAIDNFAPFYDALASTQAEGR